MKFEHRSKQFDIEGISQNDHIYKIISRSGNFYEIDLLEYIYHLRPYLRLPGKKNVIVDVGANIGNHSIFFGSFIADHILAVEPNPNVLPVLQRNLSKNVKNYSLVEHAVGESEGAGSIEIPDVENVGAGKMNLQSDEGNIEISTLDSVMSSLSGLDSESISLSLIKIDVEGMELQVLKGGRETILKHKPHIFAEAATREELNIIFNFLEPMGYKKLPGRWAATPVYHFACKPTLFLTLTSFLLQVKRVIKKVKFRLPRRFT